MLPYRATFGSEKNYLSARLPIHRSEIFFLEKEKTQSSCDDWVLKRKRNEKRENK
jgi:hypothetical protein